jgi:hypothetical protein
MCFFDDRASALVLRLFCIPSLLFRFYNRAQAATIEATAKNASAKGETNMKNLLLCLVLVAAGSLWASAQDAPSKGKAHTRAITGCLSQGDSQNEFLLTGKDGSTWEVRSDAVSLAGHVGHTVTATGTVRAAAMHNMKEDAKDAAQDAGMKHDNNEHGHLQITDIKMISDSCSK